MEIGTKVKIDKCDECPTIVGKTAKVRGFTETPDVVLLNFGRGRPQSGRPKSMSVANLSVVLSEGNENV